MDKYVVFTSRTNFENGTYEISECTTAADIEVANSVLRHNVNQIFDDIKRRDGSCHAIPHNAGCFLLDGNDIVNVVLYQFKLKESKEA